MAKLTANTVVLKGFEAVVLYAGAEVPEWAADQVGDHLLEASVEDDTGDGQSVTRRRR